MVVSRCRYDAVVFDLLTALIDSWSLWNDIAGSAERGLVWRRKYLELTYGQGRYRDYVAIASDAAQAVHDLIAELVNSGPFASPNFAIS